MVLLKRYCFSPIIQAKSKTIPSVSEDVAKQYFHAVVMGM